MWIKTGQVTQHQQLSQRLGRDGSTVTRWLQKYRQGGLKKLLEVKTSPGADPKITTEMRSRLEEKLESPQGFVSYGGNGTKKTQSAYFISTLRFWI